MNLYLPLQNLNRTKINTFGLCWILYFNHNDVQSWPPMDPLNGVINSSLVFKPGGKFYTAQFIEKDRLFQEVQREDPLAGPFVESSVAGILGGNSLNHITAITSIMGGKFGVLLKERNGEQRLIGSQDAWAQFTWDYTSGEGSNSRKRGCRWRFESSLPVPVYQGGNLIIDNQIIPIGGAPSQGGSGVFQLFTRFDVGQPGGMINGELTFTDAALTGKKVLVFADGIKIPQSSAPVVTKRTVSKEINQNTIHFNGGVVQGETIEIFIHL